MDSTIFSGNLKLHKYTRTCIKHNRDKVDLITLYTSTHHCYVITMLEVKPANTCTADCTDISPLVARTRFTPSEQNFLTCLAYSMFLKDSMVL